jgi:CheY-like chemotaxis protein
MEKAHILVANDDKAFLELMKDLLEEEGYSVSLQKTGTTAYEKIKKALPDVVILDIIMETLDTGWRVLDRLKLDPETTNIPVIICSADVHSLRNKADHLLSMGCLVLALPFDIDTMLATIEESLTLSPVLARRPDALLAKQTSPTKVVA